MSKITRDEVKILINEGMPDGYWSDGSVVNNMATDLMQCINQREEEFAELVKAATNYVERPFSASLPRDFTNLKAAVKPFLPPPSPADRLDALADEYCISDELEKEIHALAAELREGEK